MKRKDDSYKPYSGETSSDTPFNLFVDLNALINRNSIIEDFFNTKYQVPSVFSEIKNLFGSQFQDLSMFSDFNSGFYSSVSSFAGQKIANEYFISTNSQAEYIGSQIGSTVGSTVGYYFGGSIGAGVGSFVGAIVGDSIGETYNEVDELFDDGFRLDEIDDFLKIAVNLPFDVADAFMGNDEKPPPPVAEVVYEFNAETGEYELNTNRSREHDGGKISHVQGPGDQMTDVVEKLLERYTQGEAQLANRHEMPEIKIGYEGDNQYVMVNGKRIGGLNGESIQAAIGEVLGNAVIEGGEPLTNHILYSDEISGSERFAILTDNVIQTTIQYRHNTATQEAIDTRLADRGEALDLMDSRDAKQADVNAAQAKVNAIQSRLDSLRFSSRSDDSSQRNDDARQELSEQLASARQRLHTEQSELADIQQQLQPHFEQQHNDEKTALSKQLENIEGKAPLDALLQRYEDLLEQKQELPADQQAELESSFETLFDEYAAALAAPIEAELAQLQADLAAHQADSQNTHSQSAEFTDEQVALFNQMKTQMLESKIAALQGQIDAIKGADIEQILEQKREATTALEEKIAQIDEALASNPVPEPASLGFDQELRSNIETLNAGEEIAGLDWADIDDLGNDHRLDTATRLDYEIRHHNRIHDYSRLAA